MPVADLDSFIYEEFNKKWKAASRIVFGEEVGELCDFKKWLVGTSRTALECVSSISGKQVRFVLPYYSNSAKVALMSEINADARANQKFEPLDINELKDLDSIIEALNERILYAGDIYLGESKFLSESTDVVSSSYVYASSQVAYSKWIAYSYNLEYCEYLFGCQNIGTGSSYSIRSTAADSQVRCLETHSSSNCHDCYFSNSLYNCKDCIFSFGLRKASYRVGNLQLTTEEYSKIKAKLLEDISDDLKRKKSLLQLETFFISVKPNLEKGKAMPKKVLVPEQFDKNVIEDAYRKTTKILFGKELFGLDKYGPWLKEHTRDLKICTSVLSGEKIIVPDYSNCYYYPENRIVSQQEILAIGENVAIDRKNIDHFSLKTAGEAVNDAAFFSSAENYGVLKNNVESEINISCQNFYKSVLNISSKYGAYNFHGLESEYLFGTYSLRKCTFCIRCYLSANLSRCFEVDSSRACSDCYFCHNCENVRDSMFCFNAKNMTNAIGNVVLPREKYLEIKNKILAEIANALERDSRYDINIFNLSDLVS